VLVLPAGMRSAGARQNSGSNGSHLVFKMIFIHSRSQLDAATMLFMLPPWYLIQYCWIKAGTSEKNFPSISPFVHPNGHVITCSSFMWPEMHASAEAFTWFL
jgi:hypothetical protein